jgi:phosphohistidine phosphatase
MRICLVRHAIAVERGTPGYEDDSLRPLTARGRDRMEAETPGLRGLFSPQVIVSSPLLRARQTADILLAAYGLPKSRISAALASGDNKQLLADLLDIEADAVMLVGHEPHMSATLSWLLTGDEERMSVTFKKGGAALLACEGEPRAGRCMLEWLIQPGALRVLGRQPSRD